MSPPYPYNSTVLSRKTYVIVNYCFTPHFSPRRFPLKTPHHRTCEMGGIFTHFLAFVAGSLLLLAVLILVLLYWPASPDIADPPPLHTSLAPHASSFLGSHAYKDGWLSVSFPARQSAPDLDDAKDDPDAALPDSPPLPHESLPATTRLYVVLKNCELCLYKDESLRVMSIFNLSSHYVALWPPGLSDALLFAKKSRIALVDPSKLGSPTDTPVPALLLNTDVALEKEDWYFALVHGTKSKTTKIPRQLCPNTLAASNHDPATMLALLNSLYTLDSVHSRWLNALLGRLFLSLHDSTVLSQYLHSKLAKKLQKIKKPGFLEQFAIKSISPGTTVPLLTNLRLVNASPEGDIVVAANISYSGSFAIEISTKVNLDVLGSRFKPRDVDVVLRITLNGIQGPLRLRLKPFPSSRLWYAFERNPVLNLKIEPVIQSRQMSYNIITNSIEKKLKEAIRDSLVLPHWDDIPFFNTTQQVYRAGIWKEPPPAPLPPAAPTTTSPTPSSPSPEPPVVDLPLLDSAPATLVHKNLASSLSLDSPLNNVRRRTTKDKTLKLFNKLIQKPKDENADHSSSMYATVKKIFTKGDDKVEVPEQYLAPEMIVNRRAPRKLTLVASVPSASSSSNSLNSSGGTPLEIAPETLLAPPAYDFSKSSPTSNLGPSRSFSTDLKRRMTMPEQAVVDSAKLFDFSPEMGVRLASTLLHDPASPVEMNPDDTDSGGDEQASPVITVLPANSDLELPALVRRDPSGRASSLYEYKSGDHASLLPAMARAASVFNQPSLDTASLLASRKAPTTSEHRNLLDRKPPPPMDDHQNSPPELPPRVDD